MSYIIVTGRRFQPGEGPRRIHLCDCEVFAKRRLKLQEEGSTEGLPAVVRGEMVGNVMAAKTLSINQTVNGASCGLNQAPLSIDIENFPLSLPRNFGQKVLSNITLRPSTVHIIGAVH